MKVYPIKFEPILKEKIWGGNKLKTILGKQTPYSNIGESWEISDVKDNVSVVKNGAYEGLNLKELITKYKADLLGSDNFKNYGFNFPLLIKFLDAKTDLSIQVHPDDDMAKRYHNSLGKTEMWYIMDSDANADIVLGLKKENLSAQLLNNISANNVDAIFNREKVNKGDSFFIPAGKIHAIGAGVLAAEIQQTSDITYRIYDWDRTDTNGIKRELHTLLAQQAIKDFESNGRLNHRLQPNQSANLVDCDYFTTNLIHVNAHLEQDLSNIDSFVIYMCVEGHATIIADGNAETLKMGETLLIPAIADKVELNSTNSKLIEIFS